MGKYMKKSKINGDVVLMELQSSMGVRTRAKTLALQKLQLQSPSSNVTTPTSTNPDSSGYLQLRSRRLEKSLPPLPGDGVKGNPSSRLRFSSVNSGSDGPVSVSASCLKKGDEGCFEREEFGDLGGEEASFGENNLEFDCRGRSTRESTPCSFIRDLDNIATPPGSTTRPSRANASEQRVRSNVQRNIPTSWEIDEFFSNAEQQQQRLFTEKYNFDFANDLPLPGRYDWACTCKMCH